VVWRIGSCFSTLISKAMDEVFLPSKILVPAISQPLATRLPVGLTLFLSSLL
jgi:hypothetical protein